MGTPTTEKQSNTSTSPMKQSVSLTSLPPSPGQQDVSDLSIAAKLRVERPYNSLKKKQSSERDIWRNSWGSNQSHHSSCSLQSTTTSNPTIGKDDFWLALQTNYNYIMDTNLLDSCKEVRGELEDSYKFEAQNMYCYQKINGTTHTKEFVSDPRRLRRWLREMENRMLKTPSFTEAIKMKDSELRKLLKEHSELYRIIVSHARLVGACTRSARSNQSTAGTATSTPEKQYRDSEQQQDEQEHGFSSLETTISSASTRRSNVNSDGNLKGLERRYHLLYLKAIEVQCLLEGLLGRKEDSQTSTSQSSSEVDEGPAAKLARFTDDLIAENIHLNAIAKKKYNEKVVKSDDDDEYDFYVNNTLNDSQANGFDADSEGSDCEIVPNFNSEAKTMETASADCNGPQASECFDNQIVPEPIEIIQTSKQVSGSLSLPTTPVKQQTALKRSRKTDSSKFNRSNRKSKNCAIFYFKHLDTDPDTQQEGGWTSQDANSELCSEDDQWFFTNGNETNNTNELNDTETQSDSQRILDLTQLSMKVNCDDNISIDAVDSPVKERSDENAMVSILCENQCEKKGGNSNTKPYKEVTKHYSKESIQQLVIEAESLVRDDSLAKTPIRFRQKASEASVLPPSTTRKVGKTLLNPKIKRVEQWLKNQTVTVSIPPLSPTLATDCDASCEYTESDSAARDSDCSEGVTDSVATCLPGVGSNSHCFSTEVIGGSSDLLSHKETSDKDNNSNYQSTKIIIRTKRRNSERPWSVSCISQLTQKKPINRSAEAINNQGLANHSISESALHTLNTSGPHVIHIKGSDSRNSLKRRRARARRKQRSESGSNKSDGSSKNRNKLMNSAMVKSESFSGSLIPQEQQVLQHTVVLYTATEVGNDESIQLQKPNFQLGAYTSNVFGASKLGALAPLAFYNLEQDIPQTREPSYTGTEDNSNLSEQQAWDDYQEKYMSEAYSEGRDSEAARKLLEFGDDYRNFLDSQSDCCSSLSAANNMDSLSPPRNRKQFGIPQNGNKSSSKSPSDDDNTLRRRRALELEIERRKRNESNRKSSIDDRRKSSSGAETTLSRASYKSLKSNKSNFGRKLEMEFNKNVNSERRRIKSNEKNLSSSSSANSDTEDDSEIDVVLNQSRIQLENTEALKIRRHLLRPEDYAEIIATCRDNIHCLEAVLRGPTGSVLSIHRHQDIRELLASWESLLHWSENESVAKQLQGEMGVLVEKLNRIGSSSHNLDTESAVHLAIEETQNEKAQLYTHRSTMLRLNASVHSWLTRQEIKKAELLEKRQQNEVIKTTITTTTTAIATTSSDENTLNDGSNETTEVIGKTSVTKAITTQGTDMTNDSDEWIIDDEFHKQLKNEVGNMYNVWDEADQRIKLRLENLTTSLIAWKQFESGLHEFKEALGKDKGALKGLRGALDVGIDFVSVNLAQDVKEVAKRLSERVDTGAQASTSAQTTVKLNQMGTLTFHLPSNGSLSDSGISDGGGSSDYGLSERERRLGALRRLAKQLEQALVPGSAALNSINQRMEMAEAELRSLQETCRELIVRTAASQPTPMNAIAQNSTVITEVDDADSQPTINFPLPLIGVKPKTQKRSVQSKRKTRRRTNSNNVAVLQQQHQQQQQKTENLALMIPSSEPDPEDPNTSVIIEKDNNKSWGWRVAKYAIPVQLAIVALFCAACLMEPHCCDGMNNFQWSLSPQLRYVRGPPPV